MHVDLRSLMRPISVQLDHIWLISILSSTLGSCSTYPQLMGKYTHVSAAEENIMRRMHREGMGVRKISALVGRSFETISKHIFKKNLRKEAQPKGRPSAIDKATLRKLKTTHERLLNQRPTSDVTIKEVKRRQV